MPPFSITLTDGRSFNYKSLQKGSPVMLIYFAPECDHCKAYTKELINVIGKFKQAQIIMISYFPLNKLQEFYTNFRLERFKNIKVGSEGNSFLIPSFYKVGLFPFTAIFNNDGKLVAIYRKPPSMEALSKYF